MTGHTEANNLVQTGNEIQTKLHDMAEFIRTAEGNLLLEQTRVLELERSLEVCKRELEFTQRRLIEVERMADRHRHDYLDLQSRVKMMAGSFIEMVKDHANGISEYAPKSETHRRLTEIAPQEPTNENYEFGPGMKKIFDGVKTAMEEPVRSYWPLPGPKDNKSDPLTRIHMVSMVQEKKLNDLGIYHFWQLAQTSEPDKAFLATELDMHRTHIDFIVRKSIRYMRKSIPAGPIQQGG